MPQFNFERDGSGQLPGDPVSLIPCRATTTKALRAFEQKLREQVAMFLN
jgi:hypothetical protein